jgi:hypothetical protein
VHVNLGKHLWVFSGAFRFEERFAAFDGLAGLLENADHVEVAATAHAQQQHFHRPNTQVPATGLWRAVHDDHMTTA